MSGGNGPRTVLYDSEGDHPLVGQGPSTGSIPVVLAFDHSPINVTGSVSISGSASVSGSVGLLVGGVPVSSVNPLPITGSISVSPPAVQNVTGSNWIPTVTGSVVVTNFPAVQTVTGSVKLTEGITVLQHAVTISGSVPLIITGSITGSVGLSGPVAVSNFPVTQTITGSVGLTGPITGTVKLSEAPTVNQGTSPWIVSGSNWIPTVTGSIIVANRVDITGSNWTPTITGSVSISRSVAVTQGTVPWVDASTTVEDGDLESGYYPDPSSYVAGVARNSYDIGGSLRTRSIVLTDEESFRSDFDGTSISSSLTGLLVFTSGNVNVSGIGTLFTTELGSDKHIRPSSQPDTRLERIDYIVDDSNIVLREAYTGPTVTGSAISNNWYVLKSGSGSLSVGSSIVSLSTGLGNGSFIELTREGDYLPFALTFNGSISQRIANQEIAVGLQDGGVGLSSELALIVFDGTDSTKIRCRTGGGPDSVQETLITLAGGLNTSQLLSYEIDLTPGLVAFLVNGTLVATHKLHIPRPYTVMSIGMYALNTGVAASSTTLNVDSLFFQDTDQVQIGSIFSGEPVPVQGVTNGTPITVQFGVPGGAAALPKMINLVYNKSDGAYLANVFKRVITYTVPSGYSGYIIKFTSFQGEAAISRTVAETNMATANIVTGVYTAGTSYSSPQFASVVQGEVTIALSAGSGNVVLTVTYTNELGVAGRTGTITIAKGSVVGSRFDLVLAAGDIGVLSIQNITLTPTLAAGSVKILGFIQLCYHQDQSTTTQTETQFAPGAITFPTGTVIGIEFAGGTVSKTRNFDCLLQLLAG